MSAYSMAVFPQHAEMLAASGVTPEHASARGYVSVDTKTRLDQLGVTKAGRKVPGLLIPSRDKAGQVWGYQYRPDEPRLRDDKPVKYETPVGQRNGLDVPPGVGPALDDPSVQLWVTEGVKKADAAALAGLACVSLPGVWSWRGTNGHGGKTAVADWHDVALNGRKVVLAFDSDVIRKRAVSRALAELARYLESKGAAVAYCHLPDDTDKAGLDDYLAAGHTVDELHRLVRPDPPEVVEDKPAPEVFTAVNSSTSRPDPGPVSLDDALTTFRGWLHLPDTDPLLAVAAAAVANRTGDASPVWVLVLGPPSGGKTEQVVGLTGLPETVLASTVTESALLSGTSQKERAADASGGLLRQVGEHGLLVMKDFTSVLAQNRDARQAALGALREIHDGSWSRAVGTDGGKVLSWSGKLGVVAGCTNAYDKHYGVISQLGDRFLLVRLAEDTDDPDAAVTEVGMSALTHSEDETVEKRMRRELTAALSGMVTGADRGRTHRELEHAEKMELVRLARYAGVSRTPVDRDGYSGDLLTVPAPEGPGRLTIAFRQMLGGLEALGADPETCWRVLRRLAIDTAPAMRTTVLRVVVGIGDPERTSDIAKDAGLVTKTANRVLDDLALIGLVERSKSGDKDNSPDQWEPTNLLGKLWPESKTEMYIPPWRGTGTPPRDDAPYQGVWGGEWTSLSHFDESEESLCAVCHGAMNPKLAELGETTHPNCQED